MASAIATSANGASARTIATSKPKTEASVLFNNLSRIAATTFQGPTDDEKKATLALALDQAMRERAPAGWKGDETKVRIIQNFLHKLMQKDGTATLAIFEIIKHQGGY